MSTPGFNTYGAVDLAALATQNAARTRAEEARATALADGADPNAMLVIDVTEATFQAEVIDRSMTVPVVIDFWADWCGPCKQLSPILERYAVADGGSWVLAKIDTDAEQRLGAAFQVQSIPSVFVVWQGQVVPGFQGALPDAQVRQFLDQVVELAATTPGQPAAPGGVDGQAAAVVEDPILDRAEAALAAGDFDGAAVAFQERLTASPGDPDAVHGLATVGLLQRLAGVDADKARKTAADQPDDVAAQTLAADLDLAAGQVEDALARLVDLVARSSGDERGAARAHLVDLFEVVGADDPRVAKARTALANALF